MQSRHGFWPCYGGRGWYGRLLMDRSSSSSSRVWQHTYVIIIGWGVCMCIYVSYINASFRNQPSSPFLLPSLPPSLPSPQKILFHSTSVGKQAIARQLKPHLHIDLDQAVLSNLLPFLPRLLLVDSSSSSSSSSSSAVAAASQNINKLRVISSLGSLLALLPPPTMPTTRSQLQLHKQQLQQQQQQQQQQR